MSLTGNIEHIRQLVSDTAHRYHRPNNDITLLAISKGQPASVMRKAWQAGLRAFGENYWQEAKSKQALLQDLPILWHFTGPIQSNKAADIATHFDWVHSVDRLKIATLLSTHRPNDWPPLNICIQVNLDHEASKAGISAQDLPELALSVSSLLGITLRGLMAIPAPCMDEEAQYRSFLRLAHLQEQLNQEHHLALDTLSMGMSDDLIPAIRAGSTLVRIGRALFGERQ